MTGAIPVGQEWSSLTAATKNSVFLGQIKSKSKWGAGTWKKEE